MDGTAGRAAVAVVEQLAGVGLVDDAVVEILGETAGVLRELRCRQHAGSGNRREDRVLQTDRIGGYVEARC